MITDIANYLKQCFPDSFVEYTGMRHDFTLNPYTRIAKDKNDNEIFLTAKEFDLLYFLISHKEQVSTKEQIYENVWGYDYPADPNNLTSFIRKLRKKIEPEPFTLQKALNWLHRQAAPTLKMVEELDKQNNTTILRDMLDNTELKEKHKHLLLLEKSKPEDRIDTAKAKEHRKSRYTIALSEKLIKNRIDIFN